MWVSTAGAEINNGCLFLSLSVLLSETTAKRTYTDGQDDWQVSRVVQSKEQLERPR